MLSVKNQPQLHFVSWHSCDLFIASCLVLHCMCFVFLTEMTYPLLTSTWSYMKLLPESLFAYRLKWNCCQTVPGLKKNSSIIIIIFRKVKIGKRKKLTQVGSCILCPWLQKWFVIIVLAPFFQQHQKGHAIKNPMVVYTNSITVNIHVKKLYKSKCKVKSKDRHYLNIHETLLQFYEVSHDVHSKTRQTPTSFIIHYKSVFICKCANMKHRNLVFFKFIIGLLNRDQKYFNYAMVASIIYGGNRAHPGKSKTIKFYLMLI